MNKFFTYIRNVRAEMTHVVWPNTRVSIGHVALIVLISVFTAVLVAGLDYGFSRAVTYFIGG